jgi:hypothetical protein
MNNNVFINGNMASSISSVTTAICDTYASQAELDSVIKRVENIEANSKEPEVRLDQRTALDTTGNFITALYYKDGKKTCSKNIMSNIKSVEVYNENTIKITFANGNVQTATAQNGDVFSFETGAMICLMKELLGKEASQILGKLIDYSVKVFNDAEKAKSRKECEEAERLAAQKRQKARMDRRWAKKKEKEKEARIQEMTEAIIRAKSVSNGKTKKRKKVNQVKEKENV